MYKKLDPSDQANYRPVSVLPLLSKVFEKIIYDQLYEYIMENLPSYCVVSGKHIPRYMLPSSYFRNGRQSSTRGYVSTILMDLSKAYGCLSHLWLLK